MISVQEAKYEGGYRVWLKFNTGEEGTVDLSDVVVRYPAAQPLTDTDEFKRFFLDEWPTLAWPCGFDLSPEMLYERVTGKLPAWVKNSGNNMDREIERSA